MKGYLLDTNILSEARKGERGDQNVQAWFAAAVDESLYLSVLTVGEIRKGIENIRRRDIRQGRVLDKWVRQLTLNFQERILDITIAVAEQWGRIAAIRPLPSVDGLLAATALVNQLTFVTRNGPDVLHTGVTVLDPFQPS